MNQLIEELGLDHAHEQSVRAILEDKMLERVNYFGSTRARSRQDAKISVRR